MMELNQEGRTFLTDALPEDISQDALNRRKFIETLATKIVNFKDTDCLIIGIHGPWGSGKSTFLKFLESEMRNKRDDVIIVRFNPWNFSSIDQLITMFFKDLRLAISKWISSRELTSEIGEKLEILGKLLSPLEGLKGFAIIPPGFEKLPSAFEKAGSGFKQLAKQDPSDLKRELNGLLAKCNKRIIILIDDIDRLDRNSMRSLFKLIRLNADFVNTVYILSFDRMIVEEALNGEQGASGREYLEKFIQVPFDLPLPEHKRIIGILRKQLSDIFPSSAEEDFNSYRGENLCNKFYAFFRTLRDVKRYTNSLLLTLPSVFEEIRYLDFAAIEAVRVFCPDVYNELPNNKDLLLGNKSLFSIDVNKTEIEKRKNKISEIIKLAGSRRRQEIAKGVISELFPHAGEAAFHGYSRNYRIDKCICSSDRFDKYFLLNVPVGEISQVEVEDALRIMNNKDLFTDLLREYNERDILIQFLERMNDYINNLSSETAKTIIGTFSEIGDELFIMDNERINRDIEIKMGFMIIDLLKQINDPLICAEILKDCVVNTKGFYILLYVVFQIDKHIEETKLLSKQELLAIKNLTAEKIREKACKDDFMKMPHLGLILFRWKEFANLNEPREFVSKLITNDYGVIKLLAAFLTESIGDNRSQFSMQDCNLEELSEFTELSGIYSKVKSIEQEKSHLISGELEKIAVKDFIELFEQKRDKQTKSN